MSSDHAVTEEGVLVVSETVVEDEAGVSDCGRIRTGGDEFGEKREVSNEGVPEHEGVDLE